MYQGLISELCNTCGGGSSDDTWFLVFGGIRSMSSIFEKYLDDSEKNTGSETNISIIESFMIREGQRIVFRQEAKMHFKTKL